MPVATPASTTLAWLVPVMGPAMAAVELKGNSRGMLIGRLEHCDVRLAVDSVSRNHARIRFDGVRWSIADLKSRWGTFVNGVKIEPNSDVPLAEGDLLRIIPWTFRFSTSPSAKTGLLDGALDSVDDRADPSRTVEALSGERLPSLTDEMLALLLESASEIHAAKDEKTLAETLLDKACLGSGLPNAWVLKPAGAAARFEVIASRSAGGSSIAYSRSLLNAASEGQMAELSTDRQEFDSALSIVSMGVRTALCVPLMLGQTVAAYLYLDSRGDPNSAQRLPLRPHAAAFCRALGKMSSLALANLKRLEMERRTAAVEADLAAASVAQQLILPQREGKLGPWTYTGESRQGDGLGGDFYDLLLLEGERLAVAIGDVSGHGIAASVLMTACAGYLHAMLQETGDATLSVRRLNQFVGPRRMDKFVTLWVGVLDLPKRTFQYVDAGHSYALLADSSGQWQQLGNGQIPVGVVEDYPYQALTLPLPPTGRLLLVSDGIVEQFDPPGDSPELKQFGLEGIESVTRGTPASADLVAALFNAVVKHAGRTRLTDDATAVVVKWGAMT